MEREGSALAVIMAFVSGAMAGLGVGLMLAPRSGEESRKVLRGYAKKAEEEITDTMKDLSEKVTDLKDALQTCKEACEENIKTCKDQIKTTVGLR